MSEEGVFFHFRPDLLEALVSAIALLNKGKQNVLNFFRGAGVPPALMRDEMEQVQRDRSGISKYVIARNILVQLNQQGDKQEAVAQRRQVARRVSEWEDFSTCWPKDELAAKGAVQEVRRLINVYDSFTRIQQQAEMESAKHRNEQSAKADALVKRNAEFDAIKHDFYALFDPSANPQKRGKALEGVMNRFFSHFTIGIREAFTVTCDETGQALEQIDGVVEIDKRNYLVEMKWEKEPMDVPKVGNHLNRVFMRNNSGDIRGMLIAYSGFTPPAIASIQKAKIAGAFAFCCTVYDIFNLLEERGDLLKFCQARITAADVDENPWLR